MISAINGQKPASSSPAAEEPASASSDAITLDLALARENFGSDEKLLCEIAGVFIEDVPQLIAELEKAYKNADTTSVCRLAHSLKGLCATFGAEPARKYAQCIEQECCEGRSASITPEQIERLVQSLQSTMAMLRSELRLSA